MHYDVMNLLACRSSGGSSQDVAKGAGRSGRYEEMRGGEGRGRVDERGYVKDMDGGWREEGSILSSH